MEDAGELHAPRLRSVQSVRIQNAASGYDGAQHELGASSDIDRGICQSTELEKDGGGHGHRETEARL